METNKEIQSIEQNLCDLKPGDRATVLRLEVEGVQRRRLMDLGLVPGTTVSADLVSPMGDPTAYRIRESLIALRKDQARLVIVQPETEHHTIRGRSK
jgi:ferrous iron transport protein A